MKHRFIRLTALLLTALAAAGCSPRATWMPLWSTPMPGRTAAATVAPPATGAADASAEHGEDSIFTTGVEKMDNPRIVVYKSKHILEVFDGDALMARMKAAMGRGEGAKEKSGDNKTPEGQYYICKTSGEGKFYKSLFLSYPNSDDAYAGLNGGVIDQEQYDAIVTAVDKREQPPWDTDLGGEIAINGIGTGGKDKTGDWTAGNIAVSDSDMDYLWQYIDIGTDVVINP